MYTVQVHMCTIHFTRVQLKRVQTHLPMSLLIVCKRSEQSVSSLSDKMNVINIILCQQCTEETGKRSCLTTPEGKVYLLIILCPQCSLLNKDMREVMQKRVQLMQQQPDRLEAAVIMIPTSQTNPNILKKKKLNLYTLKV